ncbi:hypothetical protein JOF28_000276 [Leucobacter exalbidus]|uniref:Fido domain-containing protein n=1 Tax=Leucobacter exalbidus TaxID=662960 RepID=A0A940PTM4_9MICO|nr:hypothetical protein [Leucobacter exalbidus]MBP1325044.1 hypothetical protein [Leucobacter exalbidus]
MNPDLPPQKQWGRSAAEAAHRRAAHATGPGASRPGERASRLRADPSLVTTGRISWQPQLVDFSLIPESPTPRALFRLEKALPSLIWNAAALEGNTFTLPQVRTLLEGVTVGGKRQEEAEQILALSAAMDLMVREVRSGTFTLRKELSDAVHGVVARHEAIESGHFRGEGVTQGGGAVRLAGGGTVKGDRAGDHGELLRADYENLLASLATLDDPRATALAYFCSATRSQFYFDGNKRTARIMMTGALLQAGFEAINIPYARSEEFNVALDRLFQTDDATELMEFLTTCAPEVSGS